MIRDNGVVYAMVCISLSLAPLDTLDGDFKALHFQIVDLISDENGEELGKEQDTLDKHKDNVSSLSVRLHKLLKTSHSPSNPGNSVTYSMCLVHAHR